ncbi:MAG: hypothetical protein MUF31_01355 [Akkermansiaceae bacterium]|jgi:hypothetical protein|nr:hypothetical protein [Akkermansiaceae bacterium]
MKTTLVALLVAGFVLPSVVAAADDCQTVVQRIESTAKRAKVDPVELLRLVDREVSAHPDCACEIVKAAIIGTDSDKAIVGYVVETAIMASPDNLRLIAQCAIATAPDSLDRVQEVLARLEPAAGREGHSAKSAKSAKEFDVKPAQAPPNPLDIFYIPPPIPPVPPPIVPPVATPVNPK